VDQTLVVGSSTRGIGVVVPKLVLFLAVTRWLNNNALLDVDFFTSMHITSMRQSHII
jgi:hypothetical protein